MITNDNASNDGLTNSDRERIRNNEATMKKLTEESHQKANIEKSIDSTDEEKDKAVKRRLKINDELRKLSDENQAIRKEGKRRLGK